MFFDYTITIVNFLPACTNSNGYSLPKNSFECAFKNLWCTNPSNHQIGFQKEKNSTQPNEFVAIIFIFPKVLLYNFISNNPLI